MYLDNFYISVLVTSIPISISILGLLILNLMLRVQKAFSHRERPLLLKLYSIFIHSVPISIVAIVAGYLTGLSRAPAVTALIPATLTFIGGLILYMIGRGKNITLRVSVYSLAFAFYILYGTLVGSDHRKNAERIHAREAIEEKIRLEILEINKRRALRMLLDN